jgi:hypothetical protein
VHGVSAAVLPVGSRLVVSTRRAVSNG